MDTIVSNAKGLVQGSISSGMTPPFRIVVPAGTNLSEMWGEENMTLEQRLKDLDHVQEVKVGTGRGTSVESIGQEDEQKHLTAPR